MYRRSSESRMRPGTWRGVSKWSRHKDRYIGRLYSDIGKVPSDSGIFGVPGSYGNRGERPKGRRRAPPFWSELERGAAPFSFSLSSSFLLNYSNKERRSPTPGGSRTPPLGAPPPLGRPSSPCSFIYGGRGHPIDTTIDLLIS